MNRQHESSAASAAPRVTLRQALQAGAAEMDRTEPPAWLEHAILARMPAGAALPRSVATPPGPRAGRWQGAAAAAGALGLAALLLAVLALPPQAPQSMVPVAGRVSGFVPWVSRDALAQAVARPTTAWLVSTEMPRDRLAALGLPYDPARAGDSVRAELLMHPSGQVLAVRLLPD